jgi:hypothetical protein
MSQFDWPIANKVETVEAPYTKRVYGRTECLSFGPPSLKVRRGGLGQNIWDKSEVLLGTPLGNILGT